MTTKYIIYNYYFQRFSEGREDRMSAELCAKSLEKFMPDECKENGLKIVGTKKKGGGARIEPSWQSPGTTLQEHGLPSCGSQQDKENHSKLYRPRRGAQSVSACVV